MITSIDGRKYSGAKGNTEARQMLGIRLNKRRQQQLSYNVGKFIRGKKKERTLKKKIKRALRKAQRIWKKNKVQGELNAPNVKRHIKEYGMKEALRYLNRMMRYGQGLAYEKNVKYLADYVLRISMSLEGEAKDEAVNLSKRIRGMKATFKEKWIKPIYELLYEIRMSGFDSAKALEVFKVVNEMIQG